MKIAVLYVCTGKYTIFWEFFFKSTQRFFMPEEEIHYFVFTDGAIEMFGHPHVSVIPQEHLGWPDATLKRYHIFGKILDQLQEFDLIYFFNANCEFRQVTSTEFIPSREEGLLVVQHPGFYNKPAKEFTYERNPFSKAYIPCTEGSVYICGGVNGGWTEDYCNLIVSIQNAVDEDEMNGVTAVWHDESHLNKYILDKRYRLLSPAYCFPEGWHLPFEEIIRIRDKNNYGGHNALRGESKLNNVPSSFFEKIKSKIKRFI